MRKGLAARVVAAAWLLGGLSASASAQPAYVITDVGPTNQTIPCGQSVLNASGQAALTAKGGVYLSAYLVDSTGTRIDVGTLFGQNTYATGINAAGAIIGISTEEALTTAGHPFLWTPGTGMIDLVQGFGSACGINSAGDVVGFGGGRYVSGAAYIYTGGQTYSLMSLSIVGREAWTFLWGASAINDAGQILGAGTINGETHAFVLTPTEGGQPPNLLYEPGFEGYAPPALGLPGFLSDDTIRQVPAKSETNQPHSGLQNGACWTTDDLDCGMFQQLFAPRTGTYTFTIFANADREGGYVGANVNGATVAALAVDVRGFGNYGNAYTMTFSAAQGDEIRVWAYSPAAPGYVVVDDASLVIK